jgi:DNA-binding CsgD family transcriptional regulator
MALLGRRTEAEEMHRRLAALNDDLPLTAFLRDHLAGLLALLAGRPDQAEDILIRATEWEARLPIARVGGSARLLLARLLLDQGQTEAALAAVTAVLGAWDEAGTPGCAIFDGPAGLPALRLAAEHGHGGAARLLPLFSSPTGARRPWPAAPGVSGPAGDQVALSEPLTQREGEVLRLIVAGRTNRQIAQELFIATETVKSHVVHIFRKLDVTSRTQAAIRGRELGF